jgi:large subunit ribosomal protein L9e
MRCVHAHFPINVQITNGDRTVEIRNFLGERRVRRVDLIDGVQVIRSADVKDQLEFTGNDIDDISVTCAYYVTMFCTVHMMS